MSSVDRKNTQYHERSDAPGEFNRQELHHLRTLLRRVRYLETQLARRGNPSNDSALHVSREMDALVYVLAEVCYLDESRLTEPISV